MKITFSTIKCPLANNGGSRTIVKSANTLVDLGYEVTIIGNEDTSYSWGGLKAQYIKVKYVQDVPPSDVIVATGFKSVCPMLYYPKRCGKKFHWIRGLETWNFNEDVIRLQILEYPTIKIVNGTQLQTKLKAWGHEPFVVRPGYDFDTFAPLGLRGKDKTIRLGAMYYEGKKRRTKRTEWIFNAVKQLRQRHNIELIMYGAEKKPDNELITRYISNPSDAQKNQVYNYVDLWLAPTELEGLHMPPAEAMLTECPVVGTYAELSGTEDYLDSTTGFLAENNFNDWSKQIEFAIINKALRKKTGKTARKKIISLGSREDNMKKLVEVLSL